ncbi:MAG: hypothetical protein KJ000_34185 [Pirellulaceae bacterium]|nr:hypothetical protein [Pirellulaceae bacterium]
MPAGFFSGEVEVHVPRAVQTAGRHLCFVKGSWERDTLRLHAGFWYRQAEPKLAGGLVGLKVKQRLAELEKLEREVPAAPSDATVHRGADPRQQLFAGAVLLMMFEPDTATP